MRNNKLFITLISLDFLFLFLHLLLGGNWTLFHLDYEWNLPTTYQSFKLILFGLFFLWQSIKVLSKYEIKYFTIPLSLFLIALGLDELLQIHENIYRIFEFFEWLHPSKIVDASMKMGYRSSLWILYYLPAMFIFIFWSGYWFRHFQSKMKSNLKIIALSSLCFFTILVMEVLSTTGSYSDIAYFWMITAEEMAEMIFASTLILVGSKVTTHKN